MHRLTTVLIIVAVICTVAVPVALARRGSSSAERLAAGAGAIARPGGHHPSVRLDHPAFRPTYFVRR